MTQERAWDSEYKKQRLLTNENKPQSDVVRFVTFLKKEKKVSIDGMSLLDLGCGTGRNAFYFTELGATVTGFEISDTALSIAKQNTHKAGLSIEYKKQSIGEVFVLDDNTFDIALDVTSSNSLFEKERNVYIQETHRVLKPGGYFFTKALCKDGDHNAQTLLKQSPGPEHDMYYMKELDLYERVWSRQDFIDLYSPLFDIVSLEKKTSYTKMNNRNYKRNFWIAYMQKK